MKKSGSAGLLLCILLLSVAARGAQGAVSAVVDRQHVAMGDSLRLTITTDGDERLDELQLEPLQRDFDILQRSTSSSMSIVNGSSTHTRQLLLDITPRREGALQIPALRIGNATTTPVAVRVDPAPAAADPGQTVRFEAEVDRDQVYVQGQVLLTLRLQQAINLDSRSITELKLDNAFVKQLGQNSFQRTIGGRPWLVHEIRYAVFPEQSGTLEIPAQVFSARESTGSRSLFDRGAGRQLRRTTEPLTVEVLPRPADFPAATWLPARDLRVEEQWSRPPEHLRVGESVTRTIRLVGEGLQGAQLPPVLFPATEGLKYYPDQPVIEDRETAEGLTGVREDSAALVPTKAGSWQIPELRVPWWDTGSGEVRYAVLPARQLEVAPGAPAADPAPPPSLAEESAEQVRTAPAQGSAALWQGIAAVCALGWLSTLAWILLGRRGTPAAEDGRGDNPRESKAWKQLLAACATDNPAQARGALVRWVAAQSPRQQIHSLSQVRHYFADPALAGELDALDEHLYRPGAAQTPPWRGERLAGLLKVLRRQRRDTEGGGSTLALYPQQG